MDFLSRLVKRCFLVGILLLVVAMKELSDLLRANVTLNYRAGRFSFVVIGETFPAVGEPSI